MNNDIHHGFPFASSLLSFRGTVSLIGSFFQAHNPSMFDQELAGDAEVTGSSCLTGSWPAGAGTGLTPFETAAVANSLRMCELKRTRLRSEDLYTVGTLPPSVLVAVS